MILNFLFPESKVVGCPFFGVKNFIPFGSVERGLRSIAPIFVLATSLMAKIQNFKPLKQDIYKQYVLKWLSAFVWRLHGYLDKCVFNGAFYKENAKQSSRIYCVPFVVSSILRWLVYWNDSRCLLWAERAKEIQHYCWGYRICLILRST